MINRPENLNILAQTLMATAPAIDQSKLVLILLMSAISGLVRWADLRNTTNEMKLWKVVLTSTFAGSVISLGVYEFHPNISPTGCIALAGASGFSGLPLLNKIVDSFLSKINSNQNNG